MATDDETYETTSGGRSNREMVGGSEAVRQPRFHMDAQRYQRTSLLDTLYPTGNGMGAMDRQRVMMGVPRSQIGTSESTFDKRLWLRQPTTASEMLYSKPQG